MLGAIIGDIAGSRFEWHNIKTKEFDFFSPDCFATDDSIMTIAVAKAVMENGAKEEGLYEAAEKWMREIGRNYPDCGYGNMFGRWMYGDFPEPYNSFGNGAAMRVSACALAADTLEQAKTMSREVTRTTHNHPEGIKGAEAVTVAVYMAKTGRSRGEIRKEIDNNYYPMDFTLDEIRPEYTFNETCQLTVPQAVMAFLESESFEDAIRGAVSLGGDSDTLAAITGSIAEAYYGIPKRIREGALPYLDERLKKIVSSFERKYGENTSE